MVEYAASWKGLAGLGFDARFFRAVRGVYFGALAGKSILLDVSALADWS